VLQYKTEDLNVSTAAKKIIDDVLSLPTDARVSLVEQLLASLNLPTQPEIDRLWAEEAERRIAQIEKRKVRLIPGEKVFSDIRKKYQR
jgi:putative addiction module component (TIGR02574 family)